MPYIANTSKDQVAMLETIGLTQMSDLFSQIPDRFRLKQPLNLGKPMVEHDLMKYMKQVASKNKNFDDYISFLGAGAWDHIVPAVIKHLVGRGEFLTAYTPYQAEVSQGVLQSIYEFQTLIANLTQMDAANASMYDGATALAEAALMACNVTRREKVGIPANLDPQWQDVVKLYLTSQDIEVIVVPYNQQTGLIDLDLVDPKLASELACMIVAQPNFFGGIENVAPVADWIKSNNGLLVMAVDPMSLGLLKTPGEYGADIVVGDAGCFGNAISFGGPSVGFFTVTGKKLIRKMPGRIVGKTTDVDGKRGFVLTLQTREQHIRREKATSNICTNQALNALIATIYLALLGNNGIKQVAYQSVQKTTYLRNKLIEAGFKLKFNSPTFKEFVIEADLDWEECNQQLMEAGFIGGYPLKFVDPSLRDCVLIAVTEARTKEDMDKFVELLKGCRDGY